MSENRDTSGNSTLSEFPSNLAADLAQPLAARDRWYWTIAPAYAGVFLWLPFFDRLGRETVPYAPWPLLVTAALVASVLCYLLLYRAPALWGFRSDGRVSTVTAATFGSAGSAWLVGPALGIVAVVWHAVALSYSLNLIFLALADSGFISLSQLEPWKLGAVAVRPPIMLLTLGWWVFITRLAGKSFAHVITTLMKVYTPTALGLLAATTVVSITGMSPYRTGGSDGLGRMPAEIDGAAIAPALLLIHLIFGFFAYAGLMAADWGRSVVDEAEVRRGGIVGIVASCFLTSTLAILTIAGSIGGSPLSEADRPIGEPALAAPPFTFVRAVDRTIGGPVAAVILALFGMATLAPACYSAWDYTHQFYRLNPKIPRKAWAWIGAGVASVLVGTYAVEEIESIFTIMGAVFAPIVGCLSADFMRRRASLREFREGVNPAALVSWILGSAIGLIPELGRWFSLAAVMKVHPASLFAFVASFVTYHLLATMGLESRSRPIPGCES